MSVILCVKHYLFHHQASDLTHIIIFSTSGLEFRFAKTCNGQNIWKGRRLAKGKYYSSVIVAVYSVVVHGECAWLWGDIAVHYFTMLFIILLSERMSDVITRYLWIISVCLHGIHVSM